ncbi:MAG: BMP family protein [Acidimicrobiia bacterium]|nr:BMP family protein [Acidimicrobiia bacterium]
MKRIAIVLVALALAGAACGADESTETTVAPSADTTAAPAEAGIRVALVLPGEINDLSWNQVMFEGAEALKTEGLISEVSYTELVPEGDAERAIRGYAEDGYDLIVAHSFGYGETALAVSGDFPDTAFAWAGGIEGQSGNLADYAQPFYEAYYLAGILAGGATTTGVLGGAGGFDIPVCHSMIEAFYLGAQEVDPAATGVTTYVGDWIDVVKAKEAAAAAATQGADVFVACGEGPVLGQIELANEQGLYATSYVGDMTSLGPDSVLSSVVWNTKELLRPMIADINAGTFSPAKYYSVGVADEGLIVLINPALEGEISQAAMDLYEQRLQEIKDGTFTVPFIME